MKRLPFILLYSRPVVVLMILYFSFIQNHNRAVVLGLIGAALLADIFDGIIARKLQISTTQFRVLDTVFDLFFYATILFYVYQINSQLLAENSALLGILTGMEVSLYIISLSRFHKLPSPHAFLSKCWGLYLIVEFFLIILEVPGNHFRIALIIGLAVHLERVLIYMILDKWDHDIPSAYHAWRLRKGHAIVRHKFLNG